jgi:hypothetical protein
MYIGSNTEITNCVFTGNRLNADYKVEGAAIFIYGSSSSPMIADCVFSDHEQEAIFNKQSSPVISNCQFAGNGVGISNWQAASVTIKSCTFTNNNPGILNSTSTPTISNCDFRDNTHGMTSLGSQPLVENCFFVENRNKGMFNHHSSVRVNGSTFARNGTGGVSNQGGTDSLFFNCIFRENNLGQIINEDSGAVVWHSNIQSGYEGEGNIDADPKFVSPVRGNYHLRPSSPCVDAGLNAESSADDYDGDARPYGATVDMGADEYTPATSDMDDDGIADGDDPDDDNDGIPDVDDPAPVDFAPIISPSLPNLSTDEDTNKALNLSGYAKDDEDALDALSWTASDVDTTLFSTSITDGTLTIIPVSDQNGSDSISLTLTDTQGQSVSQQITVTIHAQNDAPVCTALPSAAFDEDEEGSGPDLSLYATDVDNALEELTWTYSGNTNVNVALNGTTVALSAAQDFFGTETITFRATDPSHRQSHQRRTRDDDSAFCKLQRGHEQQFSRPGHLCLRCGQPRWRTHMDLVR